ncbi:hypothetical protein KGA66_22495, partial [Actinocrinis puniceicyclus]
PTPQPGTRPDSPAAAAAAVSALLHQYSPTHGGGGWVVAGGVVGMVLPGAASACAAAWLGAASIGYEYRGRGLLTFALLPRRVSVLLGKAVVSACLGALLCLCATVVAYATASLGFHMAGVPINLPSQLMLSTPRQVGLTAFAAALGVVGGTVLRARVPATAAALAGCALLAALLPRSTSLATPYVEETARRIERLVPGIDYTAALYLLPALGLTALVLSGLVAVRRRRLA